MWDVIVSVPGHCLSFYFDDFAFFHFSFHSVKNETATESLA